MFGGLLGFLTVSQRGLTAGLDPGSRGRKGVSSKGLLNVQGPGWTLFPPWCGSGKNPPVPGSTISAYAVKDSELAGPTLSLELFWVQNLLGLILLRFIREQAESSENHGEVVSPKQGPPFQTIPTESIKQLPTGNPTNPGGRLMSPSEQSTPSHLLSEGEPPSCASPAGPDTNQAFVVFSFGDSSLRSW